MKTRIRHYFQLQTEIERYGYSFSIKRFYQVLVFSIGGVAALGIVFKLNRFYIGVLLFSLVASLPQIITVTYKGLDSQQRFNDLNNYLEQLVMSFKRRGNILIALQETRQIFATGLMGETLDRAISHLNDAQGPDVYRDGLALIEAKYSCSRIKKVHDFLLEVEKIGGEFDGVLTLIDQERLLWQERVYIVATGKKQIELNIYLSCLMATIIAAVMGLILPNELNVFSLGYLQLITTAYLVAIVIIITIAHSILSGGYFDELSLIGQKEYRRYWSAYHQKKIFNRNDLLVLAIMTVTGCLLLAVKQVMGACVLGVFLFFVSMTIVNRKKRSLKIIKSNLEIAFMYWLLDISLLLQNNNIHMAIRQSITKAPEILQTELIRLNENLEKYPNSIIPYQDFLDEYDLPDVKSVMRSFYALDANGSGSNGKFLDALLERNNHLVDKTEKIAMENRLAYINVFQYLPMLLATFKLLGDLTGFMMVLILKMKGG